MGVVKEMTPEVLFAGEEKGARGSMAKIIIEGVEREYPEGISYEAIANEYQAQYLSLIHI